MTRKQTIDRAMAHRANVKALSERVGTPNGDNDYNGAFNRYEQDCANIPTVQCCLAEITDLRAQLAALTLARQHDAEEMGRLKERLEMATCFDTPNGYSIEVNGEWESKWVVYRDSEGRAEWLGADGVWYECLYKQIRHGYPTADAAFRALDTVIESK